MTPFSSNGTQQMVTANEGHAKIINLTLPDSYPGPSVQWSELNSNTFISTETQRYQVTLNSQLIILETRVVDDNRKFFQATATNPYTQQASLSPSFQLNVQSELIFFISELIYF